ncbi:SAM-dependent methyltransferase [Streptosporangium lutulentum]|uniref:O-methyltransferase involved in polyketide biosynthesis n=1 Tax=Streptosporangium lutulentum TaxID=1461250 RepID=A0ABT9QAP5_9ACTN|nr:SAM-dependent methyltransferase [Streptosporangium lutulentum]MDP9843842.1 O-methyltransferase involved in polyketide biosynthesis [Streptosporangium lutulentum]
MASSEPERLRFDPKTPNSGRMADYFVGGKDNFAADRAIARQALAIAPDLPVVSREGRGFLGRAVRFLVEAGIRQFVDIGCGLPTRGNVHEILRAAAPDARVAYVDNDPVVAVHARALLQNEDLAAVVEADARDPERLLSHLRFSGVIDLSRPVAILLFSVLADVPDDVEAMRITAGLRKAIAPGSYMAISHAVSDLCPETTARLAALYQNHGAITGPRRGNLRTRAEVELLFGELELVEPGVVYVPRWRPGGAVPHRPDSVWVVGGIGRKAWIDCRQK